MKPEYWMLAGEERVTNIVTSPETHKIADGCLHCMVGGVTYSWIPLENLHETKEAVMIARMHAFQAELQKLQDPESPLRDICQEIMDFRGTNPTHREMEKFVLERVRSHPKQATKALLDYFLPSAGGL